MRAETMRAMTLGKNGISAALAGLAGAMLAFAPGALAQEGTAQSFIRGQSADTNANADAAPDAFARDRAAILGMAGDYRVRFDFTETVAIDPDYEPKERHTSGGTEMVRVLEDTGGFISLQHTLVMEHGGQTVVVKHWRQDWTYEPESVLHYRGDNLWEVEFVVDAARHGAWSQIVYQVDDSPRYGGLARWRHTPEASTWEPPVSWRPLPRRDGTTRDDYDVIAGVNRHTVTPDVWWHEQDNSKLVFEESGPREIVREVGVNTYRAVSDVSMQAGEDYWEKTGEFWAVVRGLWNAAEATGRMSVHDNAEGEFLYLPMLEIAAKVEEGELALAEAEAQARDLFDRQVATGPAAARIASMH